MEVVFGQILIAVSLSAALAAALSYLGTGKIYKRIGRSGVLWIYTGGERARSLSDVD